MEEDLGRRVMYEELKSVEMGGGFEIRVMMSSHSGSRKIDGVIIVVVKFSHCYIIDCQLLDKVIDLIDEVASRIRMEIDSKLEELDRLDRRLIQLKIECEVLKKEDDEVIKKCLVKLEEDIVKLEKEYVDLEEIWKSEKVEVQGLVQI